MAPGRARFDVRIVLVPICTVLVFGVAATSSGQTGLVEPPAAKELLFRYATFDPVVSPPKPPTKIRGADTNQIYVVQLQHLPDEADRRAIRGAGGVIYNYVAHHAYLVKLDAAARARLVELPLVRAVVPYETAFKLEERLVEAVTSDEITLPALRYNIQVFERGLSQQEALGERIAALGGAVMATSPNGFRMEASLPNEDALVTLAAADEVLFIDLWSPPEPDMDLVRQIGGADFVEAVAGFSGAGVRGEVMDDNLRATHAAFQAPPVLIHRPGSLAADHGTSTFGIVFGDGTANPSGRGMLPSAETKIFASYPLPPESLDRFAHTLELLRDPYFAVFQSNSWGSSLTTQYTTISAEMDDILFNTDIVIAQSQSNAGNQMSRPQAWAKNIVSVGGIRHYDTLTMSDHCWCGGASIGPAADDRIKPDLAHFYDRVLTTSNASDTGYTPSFGGTSAATPIVAGHFGLFFEMWHKGIFGNPTRETVFESRPHMTTAKAMLINTAKQWSFSGPEHDLTRTHQGWGLPDLENLYMLRDRIFVVDESDVLQQSQGKNYWLEAVAGGVPLRVTLVYADPAGTTSVTQHRINDLNLKVTSPSGIEYWGNHGLQDGMWSQPGGGPDTRNTVENVFIEAPEPGYWGVEVIATEVVQDAHLETPEVDADYALVVSGVIVPARPTFVQ